MPLLPEPDVFRAISDPTRRAILDRLTRGERTATELFHGFSMTQPAFSQHLRVLRKSALVSQRKLGRYRVYALDPARLRDVFDWVEHYRAFWEGRLDELGKYLDDQER